MIEGFAQDHVGQGFLLAPLLVPFKTIILVKNYINVVVLLIGGFVQGVLRKGCPLLLSRKALIKLY